MKLGIEIKFTHKHLISVRQYGFLTGHSLWNWSKAQQCQPIPLEHQKTTWSSSLLTATLSLCTGWNNWRDHTRNFNPLWLHKWQKVPKRESFLFLCYQSNEKKKKLFSRFNGNDVVTQNVYLHLLSLLLPCPTMCTQSGGRRSWSRNRSRTCGRTSSFCGRQQTKSTICI